MAPPVSSSSRSSDWPARLDDASPAVRRVAILDAAATATPASPAPLDRLLTHLQRESDPKARLLLIRALGNTYYAPAQPVLAALRAAPTTPAPEAHAALLAHDAIELSLRPAPGPSAQPDPSEDE